MLASEIYGMTNDVNIGFAIIIAVNIIIKQINLSLIPLVICTNSYSLYECIIKLEITREKRFMINIMILRKIYERHKLVNIR